MTHTAQPARTGEINPQKGNSVTNNSKSKQGTTEAPIDLLLPRLSGVKPTGDRTWQACCPAHEDRRPSLDIKESDHGVLLLRYRSHHCTANAICDAVGLTLADLFPTDGKKKVSGAKRTNGQAPRPKPKPKRVYSSLDAVVKSLLQWPELRDGKVTRYK